MLYKNLEGSSTRYKNLDVQGVSNLNLYCIRQFSGPTVIESLSGGVDKQIILVTVGGGIRKEDGTAKLVILDESISDKPKNTTEQFIRISYPCLKHPYHESSSLIIPGENQTFGVAVMQFDASSNLWLCSGINAIKDCRLSSYSKL